MFETVQESKPKPTRSPLETARLVLQSSWFRYSAGVFGLAGLVAGAYSYYLWGQMVSVACEEHEPPKLSIDELIDMKERLGRYQQDRSEEAYLALSAYELGFVIWTKTDLLGDYTLTAQGLEAKVAIPRDNGSCYNVNFLGHVDVNRGDIKLSPARLIIGESDLTTWFQPSYTVESSRFGEVAEETLSNISGLVITSNEVQVRLRNRRKIW